MIVLSRAKYACDVRCPSDPPWRAPRDSTAPTARGERSNLQVQPIRSTALVRTSARLCVMLVLSVGPSRACVMFCSLLGLLALKRVSPALVSALVTPAKPKPTPTPKPKAKIMDWTTQSVTVTAVISSCACHLPCHHPSPCSPTRFRSRLGRSFSFRSISYAWIEC